MRKMADCRFPTARLVSQDTLLPSKEASHEDHQLWCSLLRIRRNPARQVPAVSAVVRVASLSGEASAFLERWSGHRGEQLRMLPVAGRELAAELRALEGVSIFALIEDSDFQVIDGEMFDECFDEGVWVSPESGEEISARRISYQADLIEAANRGLHGLGPSAEPAPSA